MKAAGDTSQTLDLALSLRQQLLDEANQVPRQELYLDPGAAGENLRNARAAVILLVQEFDQAFPASRAGAPDHRMAGAFLERLAKAGLQLAEAADARPPGLGSSGWAIAALPAISLLALFAIVLAM